MSGARPKDSRDSERLAAGCSCWLGGAAQGQWSSMQAPSWRPRDQPPTPAGDSDSEYGPTGRPTRDNGSWNEREGGVMGGCFADTDGQGTCSRLPMTRRDSRCFPIGRGRCFPATHPATVLRWRACGPAAGHACGPGFGLQHGSGPRSSGLLPIGRPTARQREQEGRGVSQSSTRLQ